MAELGRAQPVVVALIGVLLTANISVLSFDRADTVRAVAEEVARSTTTLTTRPTGTLVFGKTDSVIGQPTVFSVRADGARLAPSSRPAVRRDQVIGQSIVFRNAAGIATSAPDGSHARQLVRGLVGQPSVGPDGHTVAFVRRQQDVNAIAFVNMSGETLRVLTPPSGHSYDGFAWSPDGSSIAVARTRGGGPAIVILSLGGGPDRVVATGRYRLVAWSHDGTRLAVVGDDLWVLHVDGGDPRQLTRNVTSAKLGMPMWSPDDAHIAFAWNGNIVVMEADGSRAGVAYRGPADRTQAEYISLYGWEDDNMAA